VAEGNTLTNGELDPSAKDAISHRGRAVRAILPVLVAELRRLEPVARSAGSAGRHLEEGMSSENLPRPT
jgi:hypothetical protein